MTTRQAKFFAGFTGSMTESGRLGMAVGATFAGAGAIVATAIEWNNVTVSMSGLGTLVANPILDRSLLSASFAGAGALSANVVVDRTILSASLAGAGAQAVNAGQLFTTGFETGDAAVAALGAGASIQSTNVHSGANSLQQAGSLTTLRNNLNARQSALRGYLLVTSLSASQVFISENGTPRLEVRLNANGTISVLDIGSTLGLVTATGSAHVTPNVYCEFALAFDLAAGGVVQTYVNGALDINTTHTNDVPGTPTVNWKILAPASPNQYYFDDVTLYTETLQIPPPVPGYVLAQASFAGAGALSGSVRLAADSTGVTLSGAGALAAMAISGPVLTTEAMAGAGLLTAAATQLDAVAVTMSGLGSLSALGALAAAVSASLAGAGALSANVLSGPILTAENFAGSGSLAATVALVEAEFATLSGAGALAADATVSHGGATKWPVSANFGAAGTLVADIAGGNAQPSILGGRPGNRPLVYGLVDVLLPQLRVAGEIRIGKPPHEVRAALRLGKVKARAKSRHGVTASGRAMLPPAICSITALLVPTIAMRAKLDMGQVKAAGRHDNFSDAELEALAPWAMLILGD